MPFCARQAGGRLLERNLDGITMPPCVSPLTAFSLPSASAMAAPKKTALDHKRLPYPQITYRAGAGRAQRHVPDSIPTLRWLIAQAIANRLHRCPCCGRGGCE